MKDKARAYTDRELKKLERELERVYARAKTEIEADWTKYMNKHGAKAEELYNALLNARRGGNSESIKAAEELYRAEMKRLTTANKRFKRTVDGMAEKLAHVDDEAYRMTNNILRDIYAVNYNDIKIPAGVSFKLVDARTVTKLAMNQIDILKDTRWSRQRINSAVLQGLVRGESIPKIAKRLQFTAEGNKAYAVRNARTAVTSAENQGRLDSMKTADEDYGLVYEKQWVATHDHRTRDSHLELDGVTVPLDEPFRTITGDELMCPADPNGEPAETYNCRCTMNRILVGIRRKDGSIHKV